MHKRTDLKWITQGSVCTSSPRTFTHVLSDYYRESTIRFCCASYNVGSTARL